MADILKIYTAEQLKEIYRLYLLAKNTGITDFNAGAVVNTLIESNSDIISSIAMDFKEGIIKAIPIELFEGFGFTRLDAEKATGYIRPYRTPVFWIKYLGSGTSALLTSNGTTMSSSVTGAPGDNFTFAYITYPTVQALVTAIDNLVNWEATLIGDGSIDSVDLYQYTSEEVIDSVNYIYTEGLDIMLATDTAISVTTGFSVTINGLQVATTAAGTIPAGDSGVQVAAEVQTAGEDGNLIANAIDTASGSGTIDSVINGIEYVINDSAFSGGAEQETVTERQVRFSENVNNLNAGTEYGIITELKKITGVRSVGIRENYPFKGTNTILVDDGTGAISTTLLAAIELRLYGDLTDRLNYPGKNTAGISYIIEAPTTTAVDVTVSLQKLSTVDVDNSTITTLVQSAIEQYINTRKLGEDVIVSEIVRTARDASSAVYDVTISNPSANVSIGAGSFAKTGAGSGGTVTVTLTEITL